MRKHYHVEQGNYPPMAYYTASLGEAWNLVMEHIRKCRNKGMDVQLVRNREWEVNPTQLGIGEYYTKTMLSSYRLAVKTCWGDCEPLTHFTVNL